MVRGLKLIIQVVVVVRVVVSLIFLGLQILRHDCATVSVLGISGLGFDGLRNIELRLLDRFLFDEFVLASSLIFLPGLLGQSSHLQLLCRREEGVEILLGHTNFSLIHELQARQEVLKLDPLQIYERIALGGSSADYFPREKCSFHLPRQKGT